MSEIRLPAEIWQIILPKNKGKKVAKNSRLRIELFPAKLWKEHWRPLTQLFYPRVPLNTIERKNYWERDLYRLRVNGCWIQEKAKFHFYTKKQIVDKFLLNNKAIR